MSLSTDLRVAAESNAVTFTFRVSNEGEEPVDLTFPSGKIADVVVRQGDEDVWRWSDGRMFTQTLKHRTLAAGESLTREFTWEDPIPGAYRAEATLDAMDTSVGASEQFALD